MSTPFEQELTKLLNTYCKEGESNTPDFVLAQYLFNCLAAFNTAVQQRETWYGRDARPVPPPCRVHTFVNDHCRHCGANDRD